MSTVKVGVPLILVGLLAACGDETGPAFPTQVAFSSQPANAIAGEAFAPALRVVLQDRSGQRVRGSTLTVGVRLAANAAGGVLAGTLTRDAVDGVATFDNLRLDKAGAGYTLKALAIDYPQIVEDTTAAFDVLSGPPVLSFIRQPDTAEGQEPLDPAVQVRAAADQFGNPLSNAPVTLALVAGPAGASLQGTTTVTAVDGVATFDSITIARLGQGFVLEARSGTATTVRSAAFSVRASFAQVAVGGNHTCAITSGGFAYCWGHILLEDTSTSSSYETPQPVAGGHRFSRLGVGSAQACGVTAGNIAYCWGAFGTPASPAVVPGGLSFVQVSTGSEHHCGVTTANAAYCWGRNSEGQLGDSTTDQRLAPTAVYGSLSFASVSVGSYYTCGLTTTGAAYCWGDNFAGVLGDSTTQARHAPTPVVGGHTFASLSAGYAHVCAVTTAQVAYCWGWNGGGQIGDNSTSARAAPTPVLGGLSFAQVSAGTDHTCGITTGDIAYCWGFNDYGRLGDGTSVQREAPVPVSGGLTFAAIAAGPLHSCGVTPGHVAYCWGHDGDGRLGNGAPGDTLAPARVVH